MHRSLLPFQRDTLQKFQSGLAHYPGRQRQDSRQHSEQNTPTSVITVLHVSHDLKSMSTC
ncbi:hypothetical protein TMatcc_001385 [Talaromyces marneffei ATCC 18224]